MTENIAISIHAPLTGSDLAPKLIRRAAKKFQSTLPLRGATRDLRKDPKKQHHFNPRSPYGERPSPEVPSSRWPVFQSTLPLRGATGSIFFLLIYFTISIHAPLTGSDADALFVRSIIRISIHAPLTGSDLENRRIIDAEKNFNPRSPYGERPC